MSETTTFDLPANLTISVVEALHEELEPLLLQERDVTFNGQNVEKIDTAGLQLVLAFKQALGKRNLDFQWFKPSALISDSAQQLGLAQALGLRID